MNNTFMSYTFIYSLLNIYFYIVKLKSSCIYVYIIYLYIFCFISFYMYNNILISPCNVVSTSLRYLSVYISSVGSGRSSYHTPYGYIVYDIRRVPLRNASDKNIFVIVILYYIIRNIRKNKRISQNPPR